MNRQNMCSFEQAEYVFICVGLHHPSGGCIGWSIQIRAMGE